MSHKRNPVSDPRFAKVFTDPTFQEVPKKIKKVEIKDERFKGMFTDKRFNDKLDIDQYGKKIKKEEKGNTDLKRYYMLDKEDENMEIEEFKKDEINEDIEINEDEAIEAGVKIIEGDEVEEGESDTSEEFEEFLKEYTQEAGEDDPFEAMEERMFLQEMKHIELLYKFDWEHISAVDLFVLLSSFCKGKQKIIKVEIYPSEYGLKEMEKEKVHGPDADIFDNERKYKGSNNHIINDLDDIIEDEEKDDIEATTRLS